MNSIRFSLRSLAFGWIGLTLTCGAAWAQNEQRQQVDIAAQSLSAALAEFGRQLNTEIVFTPESVRALKSPRISGVLTADEALAKLLAGSGLTYRRGPDGAYVVMRAQQENGAFPTQLGAPGSAATPSNTTELLTEEVIVTARKREESVQDVPASVTALGGQMLDHIGAEGFDDFARLAPGLTMVPTSTNPNFSIRGISTSTTLGTTQAPISLYVDETPTQDPFVALSSLNLYMADVSRVEVLRGPQGTLFGSGSLSGAIRVITRKPDPSAFSGYLEGGYTATQGGDPGTLIEGMVNVPLGEDTAVRVLGYDREIGGYVDNVLRNADDVNDGSTKGGRIALRSDLTQALTVTGSFIYQLDKTSDGARTFYTPSQGDSDEWASLVPDDTRFETRIGNLLASYDFGAATLTSSSSYLTRTESTHLDASPDLSPLLGVPGTPVFSDNDNKSENFVQELRLSSQLSGPLSYVVGAYYSDARRHTHTFVRAPTLEQVLGLSYALDANLHATIEETALFGELAWAVTDRLELAAGLRAFHNEVDVHVDNDGLLIGPPVLLDRVNKDDDYTPRFTATWRATDDLTLYAQAAKGYRLGQANVAAGPPLYDSDTLWNYEVGVKGQYFDRRLELNLAAFYIDWDDLQVGLRPPGTLFLYTGNAGAARSVGVELEGLAKLTDELSLQVAASYDEAKLTESIPDLPQPSGVLGVASGDRMPGAPQFTMSDALIYTRPIGPDMNLRLRLDYQYVGRSYNTFTRSSALEMGDYDLFNLSAGMDFGSYSVDLFVKNLGDSDGVTNANFDLGLDVLRAAWRVPPRSVGVTVRKTF
jgi:outer membrane receptor protein involved in Fe transport